ncbi:Hypothetical predicted protein [Paramuricea clavata]|uniref:Uncharacterized protein n=1 Tax=Paramuricea clavata TaxID=317549 RepID=A0A7D9HBM0_PARCT|nr:Hypothetical predicted protein [Paramuricea clavata]
MSVCNSRITALEAHSSETVSQSGSHFCVDAEHEDATIVLNWKIWLLRHQIWPPDSTIKSPEMTHESPDMDILATETDPKLVDPANEHHNSHLYNPDDLAIAWSPSETFTSFLKKNFC